MREEAVIQKFLEKYNSCQPETFTFFEKPDKKNRDKKDIDAIFASKNGSNIALEHTQVSSFSNQNWDSANLSKVIKTKIAEPLLNEIKLFLPTPIPSEPYWKNDLPKIVDWIKTHRSNIPLGLSSHVIPDVQFRVSVYNEGSLEPFLIGRFRPNSSDAHKSLVESMTNGVKHMQDKLQSTPRPGYTTILLLELNEIGIGTTSLSDRYMCWLKTETSFTGFMPDQVWMAVTHEGSDHATFLCYRGTVGLMQKANPSQFRYGDLQYWNSVLTLGSIEKVEGELYLKDNAKE